MAIHVLGILDIKQSGYTLSRHTVLKQAAVHVLRSTQSNKTELNRTADRTLSRRLAACAAISACI